MVVNIPADGQIYQVGKVTGLLHVYDVGNPGGAGAITTYGVTILDGGSYLNQQLTAGHTNTYNGTGGMVYIQNVGPSVLQALYGQVGVSPDEAGWTKAEAVPEGAA